MHFCTWYADGMRDLEWSDLRIFLGMLRASTVGDAARQLGVDA